MKTFLPLTPVILSIFFSLFPIYGTEETLPTESETSSSPKPETNSNSEKQENSFTNAFAVNSALVQKPVTALLADGTAYNGLLLADYRQENGKGVTAIQERDGRITVIHSENLIDLSSCSDPFKPMTQEELGESLLQELGAGYYLHTTKHFVFVHQTSSSYAVWCGKLFESLYQAFCYYEQRRGFELKDPEFPMGVVLLPNRQAFNEYAAKEMSSSAGIAAYFNRGTNRVTLYDFSEEETSRGALQKKKRTKSDIEEFLARPEAAQIVTTVIHEATHQIAFNRGLFQRSGPYPLWAVEGLSMFFEVPDARSAKGWSFRGTKGKPNLLRLTDLRQTLRADSEDPIREIIREERFNSNLLRSYSISWGLYFYLQSKEPQKLAKYLKLTASKDPYAAYPSDERVADFEECFGNDWKKLYKNFYKFIDSLK